MPALYAQERSSMSVFGSLFFWRARLRSPVRRGMALTSATSRALFGRSLHAPFRFRATPFAVLGGLRRFLGRKRA